MYTIYLASNVEEPPIERDGSGAGRESWRGGGGALQQYRYATNKTQPCLVLRYTVSDETLLKQQLYKCLYPTHFRFKKCIPYLQRCRSRYEPGVLAGAEAGFSTRLRLPAPDLRYWYIQYISREKLPTA